MTLNSMSKSCQLTEPRRWCHGAPGQSEVQMAWFLSEDSLIKLNPQSEGLHIMSR